jgi:hypothetical protein
LGAESDQCARPPAQPDLFEAKNIELIARVQSEISVLKILLQSERKARADDAADVCRHSMRSERDRDVPDHTAVTPFTR